MSTTDTNTALPDVDTARAVILNRVHKQAFLEKVAQIAPDFLPQTDADLEEMLVIGDHLQQHAVVSHSKQASTSPFAAARQALEETMVSSGYGHNIKQAEINNNRQRLSMIGAALAADPEIYDAALALKTAQAKALAGDE